MATGGREIDCDKWRPYYFDFFNRVGNLTVLSLRKESNQLTELVASKESNQTITSIQAYL